jgi:Flp pilus assembly protein CpaB
VVTLLVTPQDGETLTLAAAEGKIHLALRNTVDVTDVNPPPVYGSTMFLGTAPVAAVVHRVVATRQAPAAVPFTVQVIRGDKIETQSFSR